MDSTTNGAASTTARYATANRPLTAVIDAVPHDDWANSSPCEGWAAVDVVRHLVDTQRDFFTAREVDLGEAPDVDSDPAAAWRAHTERVGAALADPAVAERSFDGFFGPTTIGATVERFYVWDMYAHRWDIATAAGLGTEFTDAELDAVEAGIEGFGDALYAEGICRPAVEVPPTADRTTRLLARLGRPA